MGCLRHARLLSHRARLTHGLPALAWHPASSVVCANLPPRATHNLSGAPSRPGALFHQLRSHAGEAQGQKAALRVTWWGFGANLGLTGLKYGTGVLSGSSALIADAAHSLSDLVSDFVTLFVLSYARLPPDENHPYGHGRFEALGSLAVSAVLVGTAGGVGWNALSTLLEYSGGSVAENAILASGYGDVALAACVVSLVVKEALYHATVKVGRETNSQTLIANAWHHRSDALSSVAALVGVGGCLAGVPLADPVSGLLVAALVVKAGAEIGWESVREVSEQIEPDNPTLGAVRAVATATEGALGVRRLRMRKMGPCLLVDLHADVDARISVSAAHHVAERLRQRIMAAEQQVSEVLVHVEPLEGAKVDALMRPHTEVDHEARDRLSKIPEIMSVSHVMVHYVPSEGLHLQIQIICHEELTVRQARAIAHRAKHELIQMDDVAAVDIYLDLNPENS